MSTADIAVVAMAIVSLASVAADYRVRMRVADRTRLVSPPKAPAQQDEPAAETATRGQA